MLFYLTGCKKTTSVSAKSIKANTAVSLVKLEARKQKVPVKLALAVTKKESGFKCHIRGRAGEVGPLQIKPTSARMVGYRGKISHLLKSCKLQVKWGMRHLALAYHRSGKNLYASAYRHNAGIYAKRLNNKYARRYARSVMKLMKKY